MKRNISLMVFVLGLLVVGSAFAATAKHVSSSAAPLRMSGTIVSSSSSELILSSRIKGKAEQEKFAVNADTKTHGALSAGERVTVRYKDENGQKVATMIHVHKMMAAKSK